MKKDKEYIETNEFAGNTHLEVRISYDKGSPNYFTGGIKKRGYYVSVSPVTLANGMVSCTLFAGVGAFISETNRYSDKQFDAASEIGKAMVPELIESLRQKQKSA